MNKETPLQTFPPHLVWLLVGLTLGWGINWPIMKAVVVEMAPMHFRTLCLLFGAAGLFAIARMSGLPIRVPKGQWPQTIAIGLFNTMAWNIFAVYGIQLMASGRAAILGYTMPVWGVIIATWLLKEPFTKRRALGCVLGGAGLLLLLGEEVQAVGRSPLGAVLMGHRHRHDKALARLSACFNLHRMAVADQCPSDCPVCDHLREWVF
jgi:drug/metabolite transporter (DMT)-like permease